MSDRQRFSDEANKRFTYKDAESLLGNLEHITEMISEHETEQRPRLEELEKYYKGNNVTILDGDRRKDNTAADNRATHNFAKYVSQFIQGYLVGIPLKTAYPDEDVEEQLREMNRINDADEHNSDLILDQSIYGRAFELLYRNIEDENRFTTIDVKNTFVIYDDTVEHKPLAGVRYIKSEFDGEVKVSIFVYTENKVIEYTSGEDYELTLVEEKDHFFVGVPIIEYENNKFRQGDFEDVLTLIDLYDSAQSDIANYSQDLNDAILAIFGRFDLGGYDEDPIETMKKMRDANLFHLEPPLSGEGKEGNADAKYLYKQYDVAGSEAYKSRIANDIHLFTATPNMNDANFGGVQSGEAMKYKLFLLEQKRATKERLFKKSLRNRYRLINNVMKSASDGEFDVSDLTITFTDNLPNNISQEIDWFIKAGGRLSIKTLLGLFKGIDNADEELERIAEEDGRNPLNQPIYDFEQGSQTGEVVIEGQEQTDQNALNGAQITSVLKVIENIDSGLLNAEQGRTLLIDGLKISPEAAFKIIK